MSFGGVNLKWSELKGKAKRQIKKLQGGYVGSLASQQDHSESEAYENHRLHQVLADKQLSDLHGILKVMTDNQHRQELMAHEPDINKPNS
jgi:hypothetical protein